MSLRGGIRKRFEDGQHKMSTKRFLGYDADENRKLIVNKKLEREGIKS